MRRVLLSAIALALLAGSPLAAQVPAPPAAQTYAFDVFAAYLESLRYQAGIPGMAAAVVGDDRVLWEGAYGRQDVGRNIGTRPDTLFHADGLTQMLTSTLLLRCVEERRLSLDDVIGKFDPESPEAGATVWQLLTHTFATPTGLTFSYRPERLDPLTTVVRACAVDSYRETLAKLLDRVVMFDSVPGADAPRLKPPAEGIPDTADAERYAALLQRLAVPYAVDQKGRVSGSRYSEGTLTPAGGLITTVRDLAKFDLALRQGELLEPETLARIWQPPIGETGEPLPHGLGWFVQSYRGEPIAWQFGLEENASSSLIMTAPRRGITLILMGNSDRLVRPLPLGEGNVMLSPFGRLFAAFFMR